MDATEELAALRNLFELLLSGLMTMHLNGEDVTKLEIEKLKPDMAYLERVLARKHEWEAKAT